MTMWYRVTCDGPEGPRECPNQAAIMSYSMQVLTKRAVDEGWRLGRNFRDHCPLCWDSVERAVQKRSDQRRKDRRV